MALLPYLSAPGVFGSVAVTNVSGNNPNVNIAEIGGAGVSSPADNAGLFSQPVPNMSALAMYFDPRANVWIYARQIKWSFVTNMNAIVSTNLLAPEPGKTLRIFAYAIKLGGNATLAAAGVVTLSLYDTTTAGRLIDQVDIQVPATAVNGVIYQSYAAIPNNGYLFLGGINGQLVGIQSAALATGRFQIQVWYTNE